MLGKTHVPFGIATALIVTHPASLSGVFGAVAGGAIGGWICDIDVRNKPNHDGALVGLIITAIISSLALFTDYLLGNGICEYMSDTWGITKIILLALLIAGCILGFLSSHRTYMHSFLGLAVFSTLIYFFCKPLALSFAVGYLSHISLDLFNKSGMQLFFPIKKRFCFNTCDADGKANRIIEGISIVSAIILVVLFGFISIKNEDTIKDWISSVSISSEGTFISPLMIYLCIINIVSFIAYTIDYLLCRNGIISDENEESVHEILNFFAYIGGALGALIALILFTKKGRDNAFWFVSIISVLLAWSLIILMIYDPFHTAKGINRSILSHIPLIVYMVVINIIAIILFIKDRFKRRSDVDKKEFLLLLIGFLGGAIGGYAVMIFTNGKRNFPHFSNGFPIMIALHTFVIVSLLYWGIA